MRLSDILSLLLGLLLAPLLPGIINRTKAFFGGRNGQPLLQLYYDLYKLLGKGAVYSRTTSWVIRAGPVVGLAAVLAALALVPCGGQSSFLKFQGDVLLFAYLLGLLRFFTVIAALDTGSAFEGMGASREVQFSALAEPAFLLGLSVVALETNNLSLSEIFSKMSFDTWSLAAPALLLVASAWVVVYLTENARIPVDDPNTHLELTMIHEVMVLDHGGPDFAFILYTSALKLWVLGALLTALVLPAHTGYAAADVAIFLGGQLVLAVVVGVIESTMARLRLVRVPQLLVAAGVLSALALFLGLVR
jgi:formate hydrogenlyase subunit 4